MATVVIDSGSGNLRSVYRALEAAGTTPEVTADPDVVRRADRIVVPGQGAFGDCVHNLEKHGLDQAIVEAANAGTPYFGICLGLQILFASSEESAGRGLGLLAGDVQRFSADVGKVPHMGWNSVTWDYSESKDAILEGIPQETYFYFTHSYHVEPTDSNVIALRCHYGHDFVAAIRSENLFACQFHPEKSQGAGIALLANFLKA
jgi:glutamine amidotransferase